jgi:lysophospholipase L1-like esterase
VPKGEKRIVVIGDELVAGAGDPRALGWVDRVLTRTPFDQDAITFTLAAPSETTGALADRWWGEAARRFSPDTDNRLVIGLGWGDLASGVSYHRARLNLVKIMDQASEKGIKTFVIGPPPMPKDYTQQIADYSRAYSEVVARRSVPYVDTFTPLVTHEQWVADFASRGQRWPGQTGYGLMAWLVLHSGWYDWLGVLPPE